MFNFVNKTDSLLRGVNYISEKIGKGMFKPKIDKIFNFENSIEAYKYLLEYDLVGKIVVNLE